MTTTTTSTAATEAVAALEVDNNRESSGGATMEEGRGASNSDGEAYVDDPAYSNVHHDQERQQEPLRRRVPSSQQPKSWKDALRGYVQSQDFRELLACIVFIVLALVIYMVDPNPRQRPIPYQYLENTSDYVVNQYYNSVFTAETVDDEWLIVIAEVVPLVLQLLLSLYFGRCGDAHSTLCVYLVSLGISLLATEALKLYVGYLRPYFYQACVPDGTYETCTNDHSETIRKSFPSGHASTAFCGLMVLTLYLHRRFGIPSVTVLTQEFLEEDAAASNGTRQHVASFRWSVRYTTNFPALYRFASVASLAPLAVAMFIAASRIVDNKHFPADVVAGAVLGGATAVYTNGIWFRD